MSLELSYNKSDFRATVNLPFSKSISNRLLIMEALSGGRIKGINYSIADDSALLKFNLDNLPGNADAGAGGTTFRFLLAYLSCLDGYKGVLKGTTALHHRPVRPLVEALNAVGADIKYAQKEGFPPLIINGRKLTGGKVSLDGSISSQFITALLLIAPSMDNGLDLTLTGKTASRPYLNMTISLMRSCGITIEESGNNIRVSKSGFEEKEIEVEKDWSAASYWYNFAAISENAVIFIPELSLKSLQGDALASSIYGFFGVKTQESKDGITLERNSGLRRVEEFAFDFSDQPDLAQTVAVTCVGNGIKGDFFGLENLRIKETDRITALKTELAKFEVKVDETFGLAVHIDPSLAKYYSDVIIETYDDHRMAMSFAAMVCKTGKMRIENYEVISKSYPGFWNDCAKAGIGVHEI